LGQPVGGTAQFAFDAVVAWVFATLLRPGALARFAALFRPATVNGVVPVGLAGRVDLGPLARAGLPCALARRSDAFVARDLAVTIARSIGA
jgi:hypothetical protein